MNNHDKKGLLSQFAAEGPIEKPFSIQWPEGSMCSAASNGHAVIGFESDLGFGEGESSKRIQSLLTEDRPPSFQPVKLTDFLAWLDTEIVPCRHVKRDVQCFCECGETHHWIEDDGSWDCRECNGEGVKIKSRWPSTGTNYPTFLAGTTLNAKLLARVFHGLPEGKVVFSPGYTMASTIMARCEDRGWFVLVCPLNYSSDAKAREEMREKRRLLNLDQPGGLPWLEAEVEVTP